jgi:carbon storage regulator
MLVLKRKLLEKIAVGPNAEIVIKVLVMGRGQVHIGIEAPKGIPVHRWEVYERIKQEKEGT